MPIVGRMLQEPLIDPDYTASSHFPQGPRSPSPTLDVDIRMFVRELTSWIRHQLLPLSEDDPILGCGTAVIDLLEDRADAVKTLAHDKLHSLPFDVVPDCWRRLYEEACLWNVVHMLDTCMKASYDSLPDSKISRKRDSNGTVKWNGHARSPDSLSLDGPQCWLARMVKEMDMAIIMTRAPLRRDLIHEIYDRLETFLERQHPVPSSIPGLFPHDRNTVEVDDSVPIKKILSLVDFQVHLDSRGGPLLIRDVVTDWPAYDLWYNPQYLHCRTLHGHRLVPVEIGRSYTDDNWTQEIMTFRRFLNDHLLYPDPDFVGYLAQHDLLDQVPSLTGDTITPDYCYAEPPDDIPDNIPKRQPKLDEPIRNTWLGPGGTVSDLHTDPYHNILCQVIGRKYIRLYAPDETDKLYPRGSDEMGINMNNTSLVDISLARKLYDSDSRSDTTKIANKDMEVELESFEKRFPRFKHARYFECILEAGDCLYIPIGWWHYVESLEVSCNVSYWFN
ncbi:Hypothetical protein D9617_32g092150 [Elsinoe fawcettii]|nr:Hypothetical protein D9617_32g092150 [Elsinoe fawcettii]